MVCMRVDAAAPAGPPQDVVQHSALDASSATTSFHMKARPHTLPFTQSLTHTTPLPPLRSRPERGVVILPGLGNNAADYGPLADYIRSKGLAVEVAQVGNDGG